MLIVQYIYRIFKPFVVRKQSGLVKTQSIVAKYPQKLASGQADGNYYVKYY